MMLVVQFSMSFLRFCTAFQHRFLATACILYHLLSLLSTPFFKFFEVFFSLVASLVSIVLRICFCESCTTRLLPMRVLRDFPHGIPTTSRGKTVWGSAGHSSADGVNVRLSPYDTTFDSSFFAKKTTARLTGV